MPYSDKDMRAFVDDLGANLVPSDSPFSLKRVQDYWGKNEHDLDPYQLARVLDLMVDEGVLSKEDNGKFTVFSFAAPEPPPPQIKLYEWQQHAIDAWHTSDCRGIVEAVTGTGKTRMALAAWNQLRKNEDAPLNCLIVVPTIALMEQWFTQIEQLFNGQAVARLGGGHDENFGNAPVCVAVVNSAVNRLFPRRNERGLLTHAINGPTRTLLIADECHRYLYGDRNNQLLIFPFDFTLGHSATIEQFFVNGLGEVVFTYNFEDAHIDGLAPAFDVVNVSVSFTSSERGDYDNLCDKIDGTTKLIKLAYPESRNLVGRDFFDFVKSIIAASEQAPDPLLQRYQMLLFKRTAIAHTAQNKLDLASQICSMLLNEGFKKTLVFFERIESADDAYVALHSEKVQELTAGMNDDRPNWVGVFHSGNSRRENETVLSEFRENRVSALLVCRSLDEGLDVPTIDAAVLVASTKSQRQRIQRFGRALRRGDGEKKPTIITLYVPESTDGYVDIIDKELFGKAATIHLCNEQNCLEVIRELL